MQNTKNYPNRFNSTRTYLMKDILEASPEKLLLKVYDFAIANAKAGNLEKTNKALSQLISALKFDEGCYDISIGLLKLYQFCQDQMRKNETDIVVKILSELKEVWQEMFSSERKVKAG